MSVLRVTETKLFKDLVQDAELIEVGEIDLDDGEIPDNEGSPQAIKIRSFPITHDIIDRFDAGFFNKQDRLFKAQGTVGSPVAKKKDVIVFETNRYQIVDINDRTFDGGYTDYITKREPVQLSA